MIRITEIVESSIEWTATVLFRPFSPKKWLIFGFIAFLAGHLAGGGNFNSTYRGDDDSAKTAQVQKSGSASAQQVKTPAQQPSADASKELLTTLIQIAKSPIGISLITLAVMMLVVFVIIMIWLSARFNFIFLEDVVKNDASVKIPFKNNRVIGDSLFTFSLVFGIIFLIALGLIILTCFHALSGIGALKSPASVGVIKIFFTCIPFMLLFCLLLLVSALVSFIVNDFALVVMYKDRIATVAAIKKACALINQHKADTAKYLLMKIALSICVSLIYTVLILVTIFGILYPGVIAGVAAIAFSRLLPAALHAGYFVLIAIIAVAVLLFIGYCTMCFYVPFAVFFRTLSIKFMGRLHEHYNLFLYTKEPL